MRNFLTCLLLASVSTILAQPTFTVSNASGAVGDIVHVQVTVDGIGSVDRIEASIGWDGSKLELVENSDVYNSFSGTSTSTSAGYTKTTTYDVMSLTTYAGFFSPSFNVPDGSVLFEGDFTILDDSSPSVDLTLLVFEDLIRAVDGLSIQVGTLIDPSPADGIVLNNGIVTVNSTVVIPTMGQWGLAILSLLMSSLALVYMGKQKMVFDI